MKLTTSTNRYKKNKITTVINTTFTGLAISTLLFASPSFAQENEDDVEVIQVSGIRGSLQKAVEVKRSLDVVADVISAEDIGKFPDQNLAESLQRISGIQISRNRGEGEDVSVRGLSPDFTRVQFNGRTLPSATGGRSFDFTILPSDFIRSIEVYKTPTADMEEGALSATVNVKTPRPLSIGKRILVGNVKALQEDNSGDITPDVSALYSDVFADGTFGMTLGAHYDKRSVESHVFEAFGLEPGNEGARGPSPTLDYNMDGDTDDQIRFNHASNFSQLTEDRERKTFLATLQWKPTSDADIWLESMYSEFDVVGEFPLESFRWTNVRGSITDSNIANDPLGSDGLADFLEIDGVDHRNNSRLTNVNDKLTSFSLGGNYVISDWKIEAEVAYAKSESVLTALAHATIGRAHASYDLRDNPGSIHNVEYVGGADPLDTSSFRSLGVNGNFDQPTVDENWDLRLDVDRYVDWSFGSLAVNSLEFGAKYSSREKFNGFKRLVVTSEVLAGLLGETFDPSIEGGSFSAGKYMTVFSPENFFDGVGGNVNIPDSYVASSFNTLLDYLTMDELLAAGSITEGGASQINITEDVTAAYVKLNFANDNDRLTGNLGIRVVSTDQGSAGNIPDFNTITFDQGGAVTDVQTSESSVSRSYTEVLPSLNMRYDVSDDVVVRFGAARVMSRPALSVLSPATTINVNIRTINSSNPNVDPFLVDQLDLSFEWYYGDGAMISFAPFAKYIDSFVVSSTKEEQVTYSDPDGSNPQTAVFKRFLPDNGLGSDLYGFELSWQQPLDMIIEGVGVMANYTRVTADKIQTAEDGPFLTLDGLSETSYNLVAYYENDSFGARLAYNYRDGFVNNGTNYFGDGSLTKPYKQLDFSASYQVTEELSLVFEALNLTEEVITQVNSIGVNRGLEDVGRRLTFGAKMSF